MDFFNILRYSITHPFSLYSIIIQMPGHGQIWMWFLETYGDGSRGIVLFGEWIYLLLVELTG